MSAFACLAIEASTQVLSVAACHGNRSGNIEDNAGREPSRRVFQLVQRVLAEVDLDPQALDCVAFGCGPGSFTGVRVAAAAAQSIAWGAGVPVCRVSGLHALAGVALERHDAKHIAVCLDARMGEAYIAVYHRAGRAELTPEIDDRLVDPAACLIPGTQSLFAAGPGWDAYPEFYQRHSQRFTGIDTDLWPSAAPMLAIAERMFRDGKTVNAADALPNYIRDKVT